MVGDSAMIASHSNPSNIVFKAERQVGQCRMDDLEYMRRGTSNHCPFGVLERNGKPYISIGYKGEVRQFVGVSGAHSRRTKCHMVLGKMKVTTSNSCGCQHPST